MTNLEITHNRLVSQRIAGTGFENTGQTVAWMGAVQAQDYLGSLWAIALRTQKARIQDIECAIAQRTIIRTWPMRGTLHFVAATDIRWMLELLTPRPLAGNKARQRQLDLDEKVFSRSRAVLVKALQGGHLLTREALYRLLAAAHISPAGQRGIHILGRLAQEGLLCLASHEGKQPTFALLEEWVPHAQPLPRDQALMELAKRYFTSHGPATIRDFVWWSGLTVTDAKAGLAAAGPQLASERMADREYWFSPSILKTPSSAPVFFLLPAFDEYLVGYTDRTALFRQWPPKKNAADLLSPAIVSNGQVIGHWKREIKKNTITISLAPFTVLTKKRSADLTRAAMRYGAFWGLETSVRNTAG